MPISLFSNLTSALIPLILTLAFNNFPVDLTFTNKLELQSSILLQSWFKFLNLILSTARADFDPTTTSLMFELIFPQETSYQETFCAINQLI